MSSDLIFKYTRGSYYIKEVKIVKSVFIQPYFAHISLIFKYIFNISYHVVSKNRFPNLCYDFILVSFKLKNTFDLKALLMMKWQNDVIHHLFVYSYLRNPMTNRKELCSEFVVNLDSLLFTITKLTENCLNYWTVIIRYRDLKFIQTKSLTLTTKATRVLYVTSSR